MYTWGAGITCFKAPNLIIRPSLNLIREFIRGKKILIYFRYPEQHKTRQIFAPLGRVQRRMMLYRINFIVAHLV